MSNGTHLGRRNTNFRTGIDVDTTVSFARKCGSDSVDNTDAKRSALHAVTKSEDRIRSLTTLAEEHNDIITEDGSLAIQEVRSELDTDGDLSQLLEDGARGQTRVVACSTRDEHHTPAAAHDRQVRAKTSKGDDVRIEVDTSTHGVDNRFGLFVNLLLHECVKFALHDSSDLELESLDGSGGSDLAWRLAALLLAPHAVNVELTLGDVGNVVILKVKNAFGVLDDGSSIGGDEEFDGLRKAIFGHECATLCTEDLGVCRRDGKERIGGVGLN